MRAVSSELVSPGGSVPRLSWLMRSTVASCCCGADARRRVQIQNRRLAAAQDRALVRRGQEAIAPGGRAALHPARGIGHDHERGHVLVLGAEAVGGPRAEAGPAHEDRAGVHQIDRFRMRHAVAVAAAQQTEFVRVPGDVRQEIGDLHAALAARAKWPARRKQLVLRHRAPRLEGAERFGNRLAREPDQLGLRVEQVDVARTARHEQENDALGFRREVRRLRCERVGRRRRLCGEQTVAIEQRSEREHPEATARVLQKRPA